jgi:DNA-directed RNA polymerase specialized sigma24 family protein
VAHYRKRQRTPKEVSIHRDESEGTPWVERFAAPTSSDVQELWDQEWRKNVVDAALERVRNRISPRQYQVFDFYVIRQHSAAEVARLLKINVAQVYLAKFRVNSLVKREVRRLETEMDHLK